MSCGPPTIGVPSSMRRIAADSMKRQDDVSLRVAVECAAVARATCRQLSRLVAGRPQLTTRRYCLLENSNDRQPACASWLAGIGGARAGCLPTPNPAPSRRGEPPSGALARRVARPPAFPQEVGGG